MSKHTPGPWKVIDDDMDYIAITDLEQECGICKLEEVASDSRETMVANANLILAAPAMKDALKQYLELLNGLRPVFKILGDKNMAEKIDTIYQGTRAIIAKAEGRE
jgi:hypothetical protein